MRGSPLRWSIACGGGTVNIAGFWTTEYRALNRMVLLSVILVRVLISPNRKRSKKISVSALQEICELKDKLEEENIYLKEEISEVKGFEQIVGKSDALKYVLTRVDQVAKTDATVLLQGETGVGKELVARAIHEKSSRCNGPYVKVNCATLPEGLVESELFGHEKGAYHGRRPPAQRPL